VKAGSLTLAKAKMAELWFNKANRDLRYAKASLSLQEQFYDQIVFHCQQAVEKSIKLKPLEF
jgi:HEPN domain-containing protein